tara:strand:- start:589 stop:1263 length:675 start_codon:yes stop_codon:yes gene_type:complete
MANANRINGFNPVGYLGGAAYTGAARMYAIPTADTICSYAIGDVVTSYASGGCDTLGNRYVQKVLVAAASNFVALGVIVGISPVDAGASLVGSAIDLAAPYILAGTRTAVRYVYVADDPNLIFEISGGTTATNLTAAKASLNAGIASNTGSDVTLANSQALTPSSPYSNSCISSATINTTNTLPVQLLGFSQKPDNAVGAYMRFLCRFNTHEMMLSTGTGRTAA